MSKAGNHGHERRHTDAGANKTRNTRDEQNRGGGKVLSSFCVWRNSPFQTLTQTLFLLPCSRQFLLLSVLVWPLARWVGRDKSRLTFPHWRRCRFWALVILVERGVGAGVGFSVFFLEANSHFIKDDAAGECARL